MKAPSFLSPSRSIVQREAAFGVALQPQNYWRYGSGATGAISRIGSGRQLLGLPGEQNFLQEINVHILMHD